MKRHRAATGIDWISRRLLERSGESGPLVLMYHGTHTDHPHRSTPWSLPLDVFASQLDVALQAGWTTAPSSALLAPFDLKPRTLIITFDDGYADNYAAFEALRARGMIATWFIVSTAIGKTADWADPDFHGTPMLTAGQLREMHGAGMEIGSHGATHAHMDELSEEDLKQELERSRKQLEDLTGQPVRQLAYPSGRFNATVVEHARRAGYQLAFSCRAGHALVGFDPMVIRRLAIYRQDKPSVFARKLAFADNEVAWTDVIRYGLRQMKAKLQPLTAP